MVQTSIWSSKRMEKISNRQYWSNDGEFPRIYELYESCDLESQMNPSKIERNPNLNIYQSETAMLQRQRDQR